MVKKKKVPFVIFGVLAVLALLVFIGAFFLENRVENRISQAFEGRATYSKVDVDLWSRRIGIYDLQHEEKKRKIKVEKAAFEGIELFNYFFNDKIVIDELLLKEPEIQLPERDDRSSPSFQKDLKQTITIRNISATSGTFNLLGSKEAKNAVFVQFPKLNISDFSIDSTTIKEKIPFNYASYEFYADSVRLNMNPEHFIAASNVRAGPSRVQVKNFRIVPYFTKTEFDRTVGYEKDRISLRVDTLALEPLDFNFRNDTLHVESPLMMISGANLQIYRNRLLPDSLYTKPLYSQVLRNAPVKMNIEKVEVDNTKIVYEEKTKAGRPVARVGFYDINGSIENVTNMRIDREDFPRTKVDVKANFQEVTPLAVDWSFDISNPEDKFLFAGNFGRIPATALNDYLRPAMNVEVEGALDSASFTFSGDENVAVGDVKVLYDKFRVQLLEKNGGGVKEFLSSIANLFVDNDGLSEEDLVKDVEFERDPTKSFWNYVWSGLQKGLKESLGQL